MRGVDDMRLLSSQESPALNNASYAPFTGYSEPVTGGGPWTPPPSSYTFPQFRSTGSSLPSPLGALKEKVFTA